MFLHNYVECTIKNTLWTRSTGTSLTPSQCTPPIRSRPCWRVKRWKCLNRMLARLIRNSEQGSLRSLSYSSMVWWKCPTFIMGLLIAMSTCSGIFSVHFPREDNLSIRNNSYGCSQCVLFRGSTKINVCYPSPHSLMVVCITIACEENAGAQQVLLSKFCRPSIRQHW